MSGARNCRKVCQYNPIMDDKIDKLLFDYAAAAAVLSLSRPALRDLVYKGRGPKVTKIGRRTFFAREDLVKYVDRLRAGAANEEFVSS